MSSVAAPSSIAATFTSAYIVDRKTDVIWFLALPYAAVAIALLLREHLPGESVAAIALWVTVPHFFVTWLRVYGSPIEFNRWRERFVLGPVVIVLMAYVAILYAPLTLVLIFTLWDHQHSLMQQHGLARIYDFKAKAGTRSTKNFDLAFNWIFFVNMLAVSPLFSVIWVRMVYELHIPISADTVLLVQQISWTIASAYLVVYIGHIIWCVRHGYTLNPLKYLFLFSSYFLWYYASFTTTYLLVYVIAHRIMHGAQYIVVVYFYLRNKLERTGGDSAFLAYLARPGTLKAFLLLCAAYAFVFNALSEGNARDFGFGLIGFNTNYDLVSYCLIASLGVVHFYYDAFIWKVRQKEVQEGL